MSRKVKKKKRKNKKKIIILVIILFLLLIIGTILVLHVIKDIKIEEQHNQLQKEISNHYNEFVKTMKEAIIYKLENGNYIEEGKIGKEQELSLKEIEITYETEYFEIISFEDSYYIHYQDIEKINKLSTVSDRYKKYIVFNENIITKDITNFYDESNNLVYSLNKSFNLPIIIKDTEKYGVEFNQRLLYINKEDVKEIKNNKNTNENEAKKIRTFAYHRIYDPKTEKCNEVICHTETQFESHIKYLYDNNFFSLTTKELEMFIDNKIRLPKKSVVLTIDDGTLVKRAIPILEKYKLNASLFLVTSRFNKQDFIDFTSDYLELHSHTHNMHKAGQCAGYGTQGGGILCLKESEVLEDLKKSREILNGATAFCYPFYDYSQRAINLLKEAGFEMAFAGLLNAKGYSYVGTNKMLIPRVTILSYTSFNEFKNYVSYGFN